MLSDLAAIVAAFITLWFQVYYVVGGLDRYWPVFSVNAAVMALYGVVVLLNRRGYNSLARGLVICTAGTQVLAVTALVGSGAGVHLFYTTISVSLCLLLPSARPAVPATLVLLPTALFLVCHHWLTADRVPIDVPETVQRWMFTGSAVGTMLFAAILSLAFRAELEWANAAVAASNAELARLVRIDPLTGLANRRTLDEHLEREWQRAARTGSTLAVLLCDIDWFKAYNDRHGHLAGDRRLKQVAGALSGAARTTDLVARFGGEECCLVLTDTDVDGAVAVAERARQLTAATGATISIGVAHGGPGEVGSLAELVRRADRALYDAKAAGRNRVVTWSAGRAPAAG